MDELEDLKQQLEELKREKNELLARNEEKNVVQSEDKKEEMNNSTDINEIIQKEIEKIDEEIKELEVDVKKRAKEYETSYKRLQAIIDEYREKTESTKLLSEEEIKELTQATEELKVLENERSTEIKKKLDYEKKIIRELKSKKTKIQNNLKKAEALSLSYEEYKEITTVLRKTSIMNAILEKKGLNDIVEKKASERTKEEKKLLKEAKEEILKEISQIRIENKKDSVTDIIEVLYLLDNKMDKLEEPKTTKIKEKDIINIIKKSDILPYRITNNNANYNNYIPESTPNDMKDTVESSRVKVDLDNQKPAEEKVTLFKDTNTNEYYARKYAVNRFKLKSADFNNEVRIEGSLCYKINSEDVDKIIKNATNTFSPYITNIKEVSLSKEATSNNIDSSDTIDEFIPGTNIKKPRIMKTNETFEEYEEFLKNYYDKVFPKTEKTEKADVKDVVDEELNNINNDEKKYLDHKEEKVTIFKDANENYYVRKYAVSRYKLKSADVDNEVRINGSLCYKISEDDVEALKNNADNTFSPYIVDIKETKLDEELTEDDIKSVVEENLNNIKSEDELEEIPYEEVLKMVEKEEKEEKGNKKSEEKKCTAKNIKTSKKFKKELKEGTFLYNIVHAIPNAIKKIKQKISKKKEEKEYKEMEKMFEDYMKENAEKEKTKEKSR